MAKAKACRIHGYARGMEPVVYVENIRNYYDLLVWLTKNDDLQKQASNRNANIVDLAFESSTN